MQSGGGSPAGAEVWHHMQPLAVDGHMAFSRSLQQTPVHTPPPLPHTQPQEYIHTSKQLEVPSAGASIPIAPSFAPIDNGQRPPPAGLFTSNPQHNAVTASGAFTSGNGTPLSGMATPYNLSHTAMSSPNPQQHYAAINQAVMDKAYAKLFGENFVYYIQTMQVVLGRRTKAAAPDGSLQAGEPDVDLGASKSISRKHAIIRYDSQAESFYVEVLGKNGMQIDLAFHKAGSPPVQLYNGSRIQIANVGFWFFLPQGTLSSNTAPLALATQLHLRYLASRSPSPASAMTVPNSRVASRQNSPEMPRKRQRASPSKRAIPRGKGNGNGNSTDAKPSLTYAELIIEALQANSGRLNLKAIYECITSKYAYYRNLPDQDGWKNSIRHNLSLNADFIKTKRLPHEPVVKGNYWTYQPNSAKGKNKDKGGKIAKNVQGKGPARRKSTGASSLRHVQARDEIVGDPDPSEKRTQEASDQNVDGGNGADNSD